MRSAIRPQHIDYSDAVTSVRLIADTSRPVAEVPTQGDGAAVVVSLLSRLPRLLFSPGELRAASLAQCRSDEVCEA